MFQENANLSVVEREAFAYTNLSTIKLPASAQVVDGSAFAGCCMKEMVVHPDNECLCVKDGLLLSIDRKTVVCYAGERTKVSMPETVETIGPWSFYGSRLESVAIPTSVIRICEQAFSKSNLDVIIFPENSRLDVVEKEAFADTRLETVVIPASVRLIDDSAFNGTSVVLADD